MSNYAIVAVGYNRADSMRRLLSSLERADYGDDDVTLIISIDNCGTDEVEATAKSFQWTHGDKRIRTFKERQGLRKHILQCGEFLKEYDAVAVFEDDIIAAKGFYQYMKETVSKYADDERIAGISLYNHLWNVNVNMPFEAAYSPYDIYFMQFAQSWGQVWMKKQWFEFAEWYKENSEEFGDAYHIPNFVSSWPKTSWLKYHIKYCIEKNKWFVYPYKSLSTCFSDVGEHCCQKNTCLQVPMLTGTKTDYCLADLSAKGAIKYDAFFERVLDKGNIEGIELKNVSFNLYGYKEINGIKRYMIGYKGLPYKSICSFGLELRPHEENVLNKINGNDIVLYDLKYTQKNKYRFDALTVFRYRFRLYGKTRMLVRCIIDKLVRLIKK